MLFMWVWFCFYFSSFVSIDEPIFDKIAAQLNELLNIVSYNCAQNVYASEIHRLHITHMVQELAQRMPGVSAQSPVALHAQLPDAQLGPVKDIRAAITILFYFQRRSVPDKVSKHNQMWYFSKAILLSTFFIHIFTVILFGKTKYFHRFPI